MSDDRLFTGPRRFVWTATLLVGVLLTGAAHAVFAQAVSIATITGRVADEQAASVAGAQIRVTGTETGAVYTATSNAEGLYTLPSVAIGAYTLEASGPWLPDIRTKRDPVARGRSRADQYRHEGRLGLRAH